MCRPPGCPRLLAFLVAALALFNAPVAVRGQDESKVAASLLDLVFYVEERQAVTGRRSEIPLPRGLALDSSGRVPVVISVTEVTPAYLDELRALSAAVQAQDPRARLVQAFISLRPVKDLARRPWVLGIRLPSYGG